MITDTTEFQIGMKCQTSTGETGRVIALNRRDAYLDVPARSLKLQGDDGQDLGWFPIEGVTRPVAPPPPPVSDDWRKNPVTGELEATVSQAEAISQVIERTKKAIEAEVNGMTERLQAYVSDYPDMPSYGVAVIKLDLEIVAQKHNGVTSFVVLPAKSEAK